MYIASFCMSQHVIAASFAKIDCSASSRCCRGKEVKNYRINARDSRVIRRRRERKDKIFDRTVKYRVANFNFRAFSLLSAWLLAMIEVAKERFSFGFNYAERMDALYAWTFVHFVAYVNEWLAVARETERTGT